MVSDPLITASVSGRVIGPLQLCFYGAQAVGILKRQGSPPESLIVSEFLHHAEA